MAENSAPDSKENAYAQLRYLQSVYSQQYELLEEQIATYSISLDSVRKGVQFLDGTREASKSKTLVSLGGGAYAEASFPDIKSVLVYVGAGYLLEKGVDSAKSYIDEGRKKQEEMLRKLDTERRKLQGELINIAYKMEAMQQQV